MKKFIRMIHRLYANALGYFWIPCPLCGKYFGGHELDPRLHVGIMTSAVGILKGVCKSCAKKTLAKYQPGAMVKIDPKTKAEIVWGYADVEDR